MLSEEVIDKVVERLINRIEKANTYILTEMGKSVNRIETISPSKRHQLIQIMKYGGDYDKIVKKLAEITQRNVYDIYEIFDEVAKNDYRFAKQFYDYRNIRYIPYNENQALQNQIRALASLTANEYLNFTNTRALGFGWVDEKTGEVTYKGLQDTYYDLLDEAVLSVSQGKETFDSAMYRQLKNIGESGLKVIYESGRAVRLDSVVRMNIKSALTAMHMEMQRQLGEEFEANMVEVSHHSNSAPDHIDTVDGKQFAMIDKIREQIANGIEKEIKLDDIKGNKVRVKGKWYEDYDTMNNKLQRPVGTMNCYHYIFTGILGISKPLYTEAQLQEDKRRNEEGFELDGKHYSLYEGQQLMRSLELEMRKAKDEQILGRTSNNIELISKSQTRIKNLTTKYKEVVEASGLLSKLDRARVPGYKRVSLR